jgi:hypothetical protein
VSHPQVLSDEQIEDWIETLAVHYVWGKVLSHAKSREFARAIESATLEAVRGQTVAWGLFVRVEDGGWNLQHPVRFKQEDAEADIAMYERTHQFKVEPLIVATTPPASQQARDMTDMVDAAMVEMKNISPPLRRSECERLIHAALAASQQAAQAVPEGFEPASYKCGHLTIQAASQIDGSSLWKITDALGNTLNRNGVWEWEPSPSNRDDAYLARCRYKTLDECAAMLRAAKGEQ